MVIKTSISPSDWWKISNLLKVPGVSFKIVFDDTHEQANEIVSAQVTVKNTDIEFVVDGFKIYRWYIKEVIAEYNCQFNIELGEQTIFNMPKSFDKESMKSIAYGRYLVKYINLRDLKVSIGILEHHGTISSLSGMFLFDIQRDYRMLSLMEIT
ncbi:hypothetical protein ZZ1p0145 [Acinetobacter phage ZZ1]|jgi:hypothetical protein|uniref:Uncharacterized protein n=2 Tax=Zedzedvirus zz1 TaxID=2843640 RepID=A0A410T5H2_9CAUD|nr:hypothetical protein ZZ1p0145 [Acinetobacter phage ZZ1]AEJ90199.1 hypothetical protein ZZ1p0145 [Acinetobacter phage ZZ1]QAU03997.1 hypothetical protein Henu6_gp194 [Acinetobacter phage Henu6]